MKNRSLHLLIGILFVLSSCSKHPAIIITLPLDAGKTETLAAGELRKYIYLRCDELPEIATGTADISRGSLISLMVDSTLGDQEFRLKTGNNGKRHRLVISGGTPLAVLYGAYEFAEQLGVRFYLHGDVIPDQKMAFTIPDLDIHKKPVFKLRGILPFHDFPEGPDWWNINDYKTVIQQLVKMKMNFIGFHCYPFQAGFSGTGYKTEPLVWIGKPEDINPDGTVKSAYPVLHFSTNDSTWGYRPTKTPAFLSGASQLFETEHFGPDYMKSVSDWPHTSEENIRIFNESGKMFSEAFTMAHELGVKVCVGTETPLVIPETVKKRYGITKDSKEITDELYRGMFTRIMKTMPVDFYWLWTPESWTWQGADAAEVQKTEQDILIAHRALEEAGAPFSLATCGWVLGPPEDRTEFDRILPKDMPFSCINRGLGYSPVEKGFGAINDRSEWSIPWMEDDPDLLTVQLWAGRTRKDAVDSWKYGCDGLFGIHWRTRIIGPNVSALAKATWECDGYEQPDTGRALPVGDFYSDWTRSEFGIDDTGLVRIFTNLDSKIVPGEEGHKGQAPLNASEWINGPGALPIHNSLDDISKRIGTYVFIEKMEALRPAINGAGNSERFNYWLNVFKFNKAVLETTKAQIELNNIIDSMKNEASPGVIARIATERALPKRIELAQRWQHMNEILLSFVSTTGELGTIANLEMHSIRDLGCLTGHDEYLERVLKTGLPEAAIVQKDYTGRMRIIVTSNISLLNRGEDFNLRVRVLSSSDNISGKLYYRLLGTRNYKTTDFKKLGAHVFAVTIPSRLLTGDFEYYIETRSGTENAVFPATAKKINRVVGVGGG